VDWVERVDDAQHSPLGGPTLVLARCEVPCVFSEGHVSAPNQVGMTRGIFYRGRADGSLCHRAHEHACVKRVSRDATIIGLISGSL
jgi:hypothetical protein